MVSYLLNYPHVNNGLLSQFTNLQTSEVLPGVARSYMSVQVRYHCGERSAVSKSDTAVFTKNVQYAPFQTSVRN